VTQENSALEEAVAAVIAAEGLEFVDLEFSPGVVRVSVDKPGGIDVEGLAAANRVVSSLFDELDPIAGRYTLEVSSPGIERRLRTPAHFQKAIGQNVTLRLIAGEPIRRIDGVLHFADASGIRLSGSPEAEGLGQIAYTKIDRARTVFVWGAKAAPSPSKGRNPRGERK
jgi:ribosome maturation factor RimP